MTGMTGKFCNTLGGWPIPPLPGIAPVAPKLVAGHIVPAEIEPSAPSAIAPLAHRSAKRHALDTHGSTLGISAKRGKLLHTGLVGLASSFAPGYAMPPLVSTPQPLINLTAPVIPPGPSALAEALSFAAQGTWQRRLQDLTAHIREPMFARGLLRAISCEYLFVGLCTEAPIWQALHCMLCVWY